MDASLTLGHHSIEHEDEGRHGHQASLADGLDFVNTLSYNRNGAPNEGLTDAQTAVAWLQGHALLHQEMADAILAEAQDAEGEERLLARIRRVRDALRELLDAAVDKRPPQNAALKEVNRALRAPYVIELVPAADGVSLDHRHDGDPISGAMARLAEAVTRELTGEDSRRLRVCANDDCRWVFNDHSPAGRRKWCDMSSCGNRAKAARHRERQKSKALEEAASKLEILPN
ncbi:MAG TPA: CGNR zinc finger domain-containing protein [Candidatus Limnocylindria bacterium]|nr:CGNR zinc finger domain-containing protein [Candidatus Limnocylindria bacterium]